MITGAHSILYSTSSDADRAFLRDVLKFPSVDVGGGWLIFGLPPSEVAVHPSDENDVHELYLICDDVEAFVAEMKEHGVATSPVQNQGWGLVTHVTLPGGGKLGVYEPRHARPEPVTVGKVAARKPAAKKARAKRAPARAAIKAKRPAQKKTASKKTATKKTASKKK
jgi:hypothetical protein